MPASFCHLDKQLTTQTEHANRPSDLHRDIGRAVCDATPDLRRLRRHSAASFGLGSAPLASLGVTLASLYSTRRHTSVTPRQNIPPAATRRQGHSSTRRGSSRYFPILKKSLELKRLPTISSHALVILLRAELYYKCQGRRQEVLTGGKEIQSQNPPAPKLKFRIGFRPLYLEKG